MQLEIRSKPHTVDGKKRQTIKVHATNSKDHLGGGNQDDRKRKDKLIRVSLCFSSDFHAVSNLNSVFKVPTHDVSSLKWYFFRFPWNPEVVELWPESYPQYLSRLSLALLTRFSPKTFPERTVFIICFSKRHGNKSCNLCGS